MYSFTTLVLEMLWGYYKCRLVKITNSNCTVKDLFYSCDNQIVYTRNISSTMVSRNYVDHAGDMIFSCVFMLLQDKTRFSCMYAIISHA